MLEKDKSKLFKQIQTSTKYGTLQNFKIKL